MRKRRYPWEAFHVRDHLPITAWALVSGSWSKLSYRVELAFDHAGGWCIQGRLWVPEKREICTRSTGWFDNLGKRFGNRIEVLAPKRPDDYQEVLEEPNDKGPSQMELKL